MGIIKDLLILSDKIMAERERHKAGQAAKAEAAAAGRERIEAAAKVLAEDIKARRKQMMHDVAKKVSDDSVAKKRLKQG